MGEAFLAAVFWPSVLFFPAEILSSLLPIGPLTAAAAGGMIICH